MIPGYVIPYLPQTLVAWVYWFAAFVVLAESLNKLQRTDVLRHGMTLWMRLREAMNALGWACFAIGSGGAWVSPLLQSHRVRLQDAAVMLGLSLFVVHRRLKEFGTVAKSERSSGSSGSSERSDFMYPNEFLPELKEEDRTLLWTEIRHSGRRSNDPA